MWSAEVTHPILKDWLRGTTCYTYWVGRSVLFENTDYIVLKHSSHASYTGRFSGNLTCRAYAALYRKTDIDLLGKFGGSRGFYIGHGFIKRWEGRISKSKVHEECRDMGIHFEALT